ncbi:hypothetical protein [Campylobacter sp. FOBRC14]|uniref:hypothetical protein n=1 Tax=Campylobacter sp. FOBRC14 TaxID=936554 RepID=UPI00027A34DB|nr:hypothetical protein [Campylobacter sp. FOBRC14]EJP75105.1 hypothetical protein HMPREF1139_1480 [Campylobacter sp. FOBRC14]
MSQILKFSLFFLISLNVFGTDYFYDPAYYPANEFKQLDGEFLNESYFKIGDIVYRYRIAESDVGYILPAPVSGFGIRYGEYYYFDKKASIEYCSHIMKSLGGINGWACGCDSSVSGCNAISYSAVKRFSIDERITCQPGENFNTSTGKCVAPCPTGQKWDQAGNKCFVDCTDVNKNKWGFTDGSCIDCSSKATSDDVQRCYCEGIGSTADLGAAISRDNSIWTGLCKNGLAFNFKDPKTPDIKDNNKTDPKNPDNPKDNNKTDPGNPGGGGNGGGSTGEETKPNPNHKDNNKTNPGNSDKPKDNNNTAPGGGGKGDNDGINFSSRDFDDGGLEKERNGLYDSIKSHINESVSKFDGVRDGIDQFIKNVQGKGFDKIQIEVKKTCPIKKDIPLPNGTSKAVVIDYCKDLSSVSEISYYIFYFFFAVAMFYLIFRILVILI